MKKLSLLLAIAMLMSTVLSGCSDKAMTDSTSAPAAQEKNLSVTVGPEPSTIDPALNSTTDGGTLILHAFEGLMTLDENGKPKSGQAEKYEVSEDGTVYTFTLRDGLKWSDGSPLTAEDFVYSWNRAISPDTAADYGYLFESVKGYEEGKLAVSAPDDRTLVVELVAPTSYFLDLCAAPIFAPVQKATVEKNGEGWAIEAATYVSNGPYKMKEWVHSSYITFEKNSNYWNVEALGPDTIKFLLIDDVNAAFTAFQKGEISFVDTMPNEEIEAWKDKSEFHKAGELGTYYVSFQTQKSPVDNAKIRKALTLAIDRKWIVENITKSGEIPAGAFVPIDVPDADISKDFREIGGDYYDPMDYEGNLKKAQQLFAEAGYPNGEGFPTIEYTHNNSSTHQAIAEAIQDMWKTGLGVKVNIASQEWNTFLQTRKNGEYFIARNGYTGDFNDPITFLDVMITGGGNNDSQWGNPKYDELIKQIKRSPSRDERMKLMHEAENILFSDEEFVLCPIFYYVDIYLLANNVEGFYGVPMGYKYFMYSSVK